MSSLRIWGGLVIVFSSLASTACSDSALLVDDGEEAISADGEALSSTNRLSMNRLKASSLHIKDLSTDPLSTNGTTLASTSLVSTKDGRDVLTYIIRCALPQGKTLMKAVGGKVYTWSGLVGIAPDWLTKPLSQSGRRWMTACLLAHINAYGEEVQISLRGSSPALAVTAAEAAEFTVQEMSFYGDIFDDPDDPQMYACAGYGLQESCPAILDDYEPRRACKPGQSCSITVPGPCYDVSLIASDTCEKTSGCSYSKCHATMHLRGIPWPASDFAYNEIVTVYLRQVDFEEFYPDCLVGL